MFNLKDILFDAHEIKDIFSENPLIVISIYRLLLAILHRNFGPKNLKEWEAIYKEGKFNKNVLEQYFEKWYHRFELFNEPENRFYQIQVPELKKSSLISKLDHATSSGNNPALFNHTWDSELKPMSVENTVPLLLAIQNYGLSGLGGFLTIEGKKQRFYFYHAPLVSGIIVIIKGTSLFETLLLNFIRYDKTHPFPQSEKVLDIPFWERDTKSINSNNEGRIPNGYLDYLTWQSRRIWLNPIQDSGTTLIKDIFIAQGETISDDWNQDPQMVYFLNEENQKISIRFSSDRQVWRDIEALLRLKDSNNKFTPPNAINWIAKCINKGIVHFSKTYSLQVYGICSDKKKAAKIMSWQCSNIPLPEKILQDPSLVDNIKSFINKCDEIIKILNTTIYFIAKDYLYPNVENLAKIQRQKLNYFIKNYQIEIKYWNQIEKCFYRFIEEIAKEPDFQKRQSIIQDYINTNLIKIAQKLLTTIKNNLKDDPRALKPFVQNSGYFFSQVNKLK